MFERSRWRQALMPSFCAWRLLPWEKMADSIYGELYGYTAKPLILAIKNNLFPLGVPWVKLLSWVDLGFVFSAHGLVKS